MKKLNITKERFEKSRYFTKKYGNLKYVSESGKMYKTDKGKVLKFVNEGLRRNGFDWQKIEDALRFTLKFRDMKELNDFCSIIHQAGAQWDDAQEWLDKLYSIMASGNLGLELKGKKDLDTLYSLVRAGALSSDDKAYIKWRNKLNKLYDEMEAQVEEFKHDDRFLRESSKKFVKESFNEEDFDGLPPGLGKPWDVVLEPQEEWSDEEGEEFGPGYHDELNVLERICNGASDREGIKWIVLYSNSSRTSGEAYLKMINAFGGGTFRITVEQLDSQEEEEPSSPGEY